MMRLYGLYGPYLYGQNNNIKNKTNIIIKIYYFYANRQKKLNYVSEI